MISKTVFSVKTEIPRVSSHDVCLLPGECTNFWHPHTAWWIEWLSVTNRNTQSRVIRLSSRVIGEELNRVDDLYKWRAKRKGRQTSLGPDHLLNHCFNMLPSCRHLHLLQLRLSHSRHSFILPLSIFYMNDLSFLPPCFSQSRCYC